MNAYERLSVLACALLVLLGASPKIRGSQTPQSLVGVVSGFRLDTGEIQVPPDGALPVLFRITSATVLQRVAPGERDLRNAETIGMESPGRVRDSLNWHLISGGEGGIRTHGRVSPTHAFQACSLNHSDTSPILCFQQVTQHRIGCRISFVTHFVT